MLGPNDWMQSNWRCGSHKKTGRVVELLIIIRFSSLLLIAIAAWCVRVCVCAHRFNFDFSWMLNSQSKCSIKTHCDILFTVVRQQSLTNYAKKVLAQLNDVKGFIDITSHWWFVACNGTKRNALFFNIPAN